MTQMETAMRRGNREEANLDRAQQVSITRELWNTADEPKRSAPDSLPRHEQVRLIDCFVINLAGGRA